MVGKYHIILRTHEIPQTEKAIKQKINTIKEIEHKTIERLISCFKPVVRKNESKEEFIVFKDDNGVELLIPVGNINDIFSDCEFSLYENWRSCYYYYNGDSLVINKSYYFDYSDCHKYDLCVTVNRSAINSINRIITETSNKYDSIQSEINELINKEKDLIKTDSFIEEGKKNELINKLTFNPSSRTSLESIEQLFNSKQNKREIIDSLLSKLNEK